MFFRIISLFLPALLAYASLPGQTLRWSATDFLSDEMVEVLSEWAPEDSTLTLQRQGSLLSHQAWEAGELDAMVIFRREGNDDTDGEEALVFTLAYVVPRVIVNSENALEEVSVELLNRIFGSASANPVVRWDQISGIEDDRLRGIQPLAQSVNEHLAAELFRQRILGGDSFRANVQRVEGEAIVETVRGNAEAIAVVGKDIGGVSGVRVLPVRAPGEDFGFAPSPENVHVGDYPFALPLQLVVRREAVSDQSELLEKVLGDEAVTYWRAHGWEEAPRTERARNLRRLAEVDG
ncbi:MAG: hypothetical protein JJT75_00090 [Opitutales bacterium]|nr:hypothetical protein [Opitutales bacterium]MCH8539467.1 hypothetical protein [Opitutales bacterium]